MHHELELVIPSESWSHIDQSFLSYLKREAAEVKIASSFCQILFKPHCSFLLCICRRCYRNKEVMFSLAYFRICMSASKSDTVFHNPTRTKQGKLWERDSESDLCYRSARGHQNWANTHYFPDAFWYGHGEYWRILRYKFGLAFLRNAATDQFCLFKILCSLSLSWSLGQITFF